MILRVKVFLVFNRLLSWHLRRLKCQGSSGYASFNILQVEVEFLNVLALPCLVRIGGGKPHTLISAR